MKTTAAVVMLFCIFASSGVRLSAKHENEALCCQMVQDALEASRHLKVGAKRSDVEKQFQLDGGVRTADSGNYVFAKCPYIKIHIDFHVSGAREHGVPSESPDDTIKKVSQPYLDNPVRD